MLQQTPANRGRLGSDDVRALQNAPRGKDHRIHKRHDVSTSLWGFFSLQKNALLVLKTI